MDCLPITGSSQPQGRRASIMPCPPKAKKCWNSWTKPGRNSHLQYKPLPENEITQTAKSLHHEQNNYHQYKRHCFSYRGGCLRNTKKLYDGRETSFFKLGRQPGD